MMERDEAGTHERLRSGRQELFEPTISQHHGRVFKLMGDGLLAEFTSVVDAVECAVALQRGLLERNASLPGQDHIRVRIGINLGEVIVEGDDRFGEGVNIAARLEQLAEPGGIWVSSKVAREVEKKLAFGFQAMGPHKVKNISEPVEAYRVRLDGKPPPPRISYKPSQLAAVAAAAAAIIVLALGLGWWQFSASKRGPVAGGIPKVAVLPFKNMSGNAALDYFSDGLTDSLVSKLAGVTEIKVLSRSSTASYKDKAVDVRQIGRELNAAYVIEGSVWKEPTRMRMTAQLIDASTGENLWADKFDRDGTDPLLLQDAMVEQVAGSLGGMRGKMYESEYKKVWEKDTPDLEEYDFFLRSNFYFQQFTPDSLTKATDIILEGLKRFPDSSLLLCGLAWDHALAAGAAFDDKRVEHWLRAAELERKVLPRANLGPDAKKSCLWSSVYVAAHEGRFDASQKMADELLTLSPGDAFLVGDLSQAARWAGKTELALERADYGLTNDPKFGDYYKWLKANALTDIEKYEESAELMVGTADIQPGFPMLRAINYVHLGQPGAAHEEIAKVTAMLPALTASRWRDMTFHIDPGVIDRQVNDLVAAGLPRGGA